MLILKMALISFVILILIIPSQPFSSLLKMTNIASRDQEFINSLIGTIVGRISAKFIMFYKTFDGLGLLISKACVGSYVAIANDGSSSVP